MFRKLPTGEWEEYYIVPEYEQTVRILTQEEMTAYESELKASVAEGALKKGQEIVAREQKIIDEITTAKAVK